MLAKIKSSISRNLTNARGWRTDRKIVVFESDDWGSIRMPNKQNFDLLIKNNIRVDSSKYNSLDSLEKKDDLELLFELISKYTDINRCHPKFTFNTVMGNPDFEAIRKLNFSDFIHEHFFNSYEKYYGQDLRMHWFKAIKEGLIFPQFHAREHLNSSLWIKDLANGNKSTLTAFDLHFFGLKNNTGSIYQKHYLSAYYAENQKELLEIKSITKDGITLFNNTFGFKSRSFIGCNYLWPKELEPFLKRQGVYYLQGQRGHIAPNLRSGKRKVHYHYTGQLNKFKQTYLVRNIIFEPYRNQDNDWVNKAIKEISCSFMFGKPAIISTHRVNYVSNMNIKNRDSSLKKLDELLTKMTRLWPNIEFLSSNELGKIIYNEARHS